MKLSIIKVQNLLVITPPILSRDFCLTEQTNVILETLVISSWRYVSQNQNKLRKSFDVKDPRRFLFWPCEELNFCLVQRCFLVLCFRWVENKKTERVKYIDDICVIFFRSNNHFSPLSFPNVDDHQGPSSSNTGRGAVPLRPQLPSSSHRTSLRTSSALSAASDYDSENEGDDERTIIDP